MFDVPVELERPDYVHAPGKDSVGKVDDCVNVINVKYVLCIEHINSFSVSGWC